MSILDISTVLQQWVHTRRVCLRNVLATMTTIPWQALFPRRMCEQWVCHIAFLKLFLALFPRRMCKQWVCHIAFLELFLLVLDMSPPHTNITGHQVSKPDLYILAVDQLLKFPPETKNQMAEFYYRYGRANAIDEAGLRPWIWPGISSRYDSIITSREMVSLQLWLHSYVVFFFHILTFVGLASTTGSIGATSLPDGFFTMASATIVTLALCCCCLLIIVAVKSLFSFEQIDSLLHNYTEYFIEDKFTDRAILAAFEDTWSEQQGAFIVSLMHFNVIPEFMMGLLGLALQVCSDQDNDQSPTLYWDGFAALYIGSLEGITPNVSEDDGMMLWRLAITLCTVV